MVVTRAERERRAQELMAAGEREYARGAVGVLMVAGGQGTRLGFPGPKGLLPLGPHSGASIYELQAQKVLSLSRRVGVPVPLLVMTSPATDAETRAFFAHHGRFGLGEEQLRFVVQGTLPSLDAHGRALLSAPGRLLESPDGHGGALEALDRAGELARLQRDGVEHLVYIQVDNVLSRVDDPVLVGLAAVERADVVTKVLAKGDPGEKVGSLVAAGGRQRVVEYTELTPEEARRRGDDGQLVYRWASPALHLWRVPFLGRLRERGFVPPVHRSAKPLDAWIEGGSREVEGWKLERFVFDLLPEAERSRRPRDRPGRRVRAGQERLRGRQPRDGRARATRPQRRLAARGRRRRPPPTRRARRDQPAAGGHPRAAPRSLGRPRARASAQARTWSS